MARFPPQAFSPQQIRRSPYIFHTLFQLGKMSLEDISVRKYANLDEKAYKDFSYNKWKILYGESLITVNIVLMFHQRIVVYVELFVSNEYS